MRPVFQTRFGSPNGNCFPACLASLLEKPLEAFPFPPYEKDWLEQVDKTLASWGWSYVEWSIPVPFAWSGEFLCILSGTSVRGLNHSVVALHKVTRGEHLFTFVHDPHPDGTWVADMKTVGVLVPTCLTGVPVVVSRGGDYKE